MTQSNDKNRTDRHRTISQELGRRIRARRISLKISQTGLGATIGISFQQVQKYERGSNRVSVPALFDICKALGKPAAHFFDGLSDPIEGLPPTPDQQRIENFLNSSAGARAAKHISGLDPDVQDLLFSLGLKINGLLK